MVSSYHTAKLHHALRHKKYFFMLLRNGQKIRQCQNQSKQMPSPFTQISESDPTMYNDVSERFISVVVVGQMMMIMMMIMMISEKRPKQWIHKDILY